MMRRTLLALVACCAAAPLAAQAQDSATTKAAEASDPFVRPVAEEAVRQLADRLEDSFVFPDKGVAYAAMLRANLAAGKYSSFSDARAFADAVTADLQAIHKDGHLRVHVVPPEARSGPGGEGQSAAGGSGPPAKEAITRAGWISEGVAYIDFALFPGDKQTLARLATFIEQHRDAKTLIIDARAHRGGGLSEMDMLFPELFGEPTVLVTMDTRAAVDERDGNPAGDASLRQVTGPDGVVRREHFVVPAAEVSGLRDARLFLLTSRRTASAGEHLALSLKRTRRATLVGETTRGAGHFGGMIPLDKSFNYAAFIPVGRTFNPDTGEGWEGTGVKPDIAVPADEALDAALRLAGVEANGEAALAQLK